MGEDGYPKPLWDKQTGKIDHDVANYWREHDYDLLDYMRRNWPALGPKLVDKLYFAVGRHGSRIFKFVGLSDAGFFEDHGESSL